MKIFTIGFTNTKAEGLFEKFREAEVKRVVDVRRKNVSQLCLLCSEDELHHCHRRLVAEYLQ
jgi:uncharacterized protein (DUF488 family)